MFSIVLPVIKPSFQLLPTINSVLSQVETEFELLIVYKPSSSDNYGKSLLHELDSNHHNIRLVECLESGISAAWNYALNLISFDWVIFIGDTDLFYGNSVLCTFSDTINSLPSDLNYLTTCGLRSGNIIGSPVRTSSFWRRPTHMHVGSVFHYSLFSSYNFPRSLQISSDYDHYLFARTRLRSFHISDISYIIGEAGISRSRPIRTAFEDFYILLKHGFHILSFFYPFTILVSTFYRSLRRCITSFLP